MKKINKTTYYSGIFLLTGALIFPTISHAQLDLDLQSNVNLKSEQKSKATTTATTDIGVRGKASSTTGTRINTEVKNEIKVEEKNDEEKGIKLGLFNSLWNSFSNKDKNDTASTTDTDEDSPLLFWLHTKSIKASSALLSWVTFEKTTDKIWIETDANIDTSVTADYIDNSPSFFHKIKLVDLESDTTYYFKVIATDKDGNETISTVGSFTTKSN